jgi:predicted DNA-binding transcriptional regulator AlpA
MSADASPKRPSNPPVGLEPLFSIDDVARTLSISRRGVERLRSSGKFPPPDLLVGKLPRWKPSTIRGWIERGGK